MNAIAERRARAAISHLGSTGNLDEAKAIARGRLVFEAEEIGSGADGTQSWFLPDEDKVNRAILLVRDKLGVEPSVEHYEAPEGGSIAGYKMTIAGSTDATVAALLGTFGGAFPLDGAHVPGDDGKSGE